MGDKDFIGVVNETLANGTSSPEDKGESLIEKEMENGLEEMEEDRKMVEKVGPEKMDENTLVKEAVEEDKREEEMDEDKKEDEKVEAAKKDEDMAVKEGMQSNEVEREEENDEARIEVAREETEPEKNEEIEKLEGSGEKEKDEEIPVEEVDGSAEKEDVEEIKEEKVSKNHGIRKNDRQKAEDTTKEVEQKKEQEHKTPVSSAVERPVRERKSVERLVASIERDAIKEFHIEKGPGTALKDIPNVVYKLSKKKTGDTFKLLHTILFGRRGKAFQIKSNISRFSGFVWHENEEKQKLKVKEKFDKCVKEKLLEFCDVLNIPIAKAATKKEDIVTKLIDFLMAPHATTDVLLAEKEQSSKGKKRKRVIKKNRSSKSRPSKHSAKKQRKKVENSEEVEKNLVGEEDESEEADDKNEGKENGIQDKSKNEMPEEHSDSEGEEEEESNPEVESETDSEKHKKRKSSSKKESGGKSKAKKTTIPTKSVLPPRKRTPKKLSSHSTKVEGDSDTSPGVPSRKKSDGKVVKKKTAAPSKSASKEKTGKKVSKAKQKSEEGKLKPSDTELRDAICEILKQVDFNTATFTDILKQLARQFNTDLIPRKASIKLMIQDELTKLADEEDDDGDEEDEEKDGQESPSTTRQEVEA